MRQFSTKLSARRVSSASGVQPEAGKTVTGDLGG